MAELKNKIVYQLLIAASQVLLPLITYPYITRVLGPENLGTINYADFVSQVFITLSAFGIPLYAVRETAMLRNDKVKRALLVKELTIIYSSLSVIFSVVFLLVMQNKLQQYTMLYFLAAANILISSVSFNWYVQGMEQFKFAAGRDIFIKVLMLLCFFVLVKSSSDYTVYFGIFTAGLLLTSIINNVKVFSENNFIDGQPQLKKHISPLFHFFLTSSAIGIYEYFDTIILDHVTHNATQLGYYTTVLKLIRIVTTVIITAGIVMLPRISFLVAEGNTVDTKKYLDKFLAFIIVAGVPACTGLFIFSYEIIAVITGSKFLPAIPLLQVLCFVPLIVGVSNVFCYQVLVPFKQEKKFLVTALVGCAVSVATNFLLARHSAAMGSAYATIITEITVAVIGAALAFKYVQVKFPGTLIFQAVITSFLFYPVALLSRNIFSSPLLVMITGISACTVMYYFLQHFVFKNNSVKEITGYIKNIFSSQEK